LSPLEMRIQTWLKVLETNREELDKLIKNHHYTYSFDYTASIKSLDLYDKSLQPLLSGNQLL
jgi:hypothetical protein